MNEHLVTVTPARHPEQAESVSVDADSTREAFVNAIMAHFDLDDQAAIVMALTANDRLVDDQCEPDEMRSAPGASEQTAPMKASELGQFMCAPAGRCLHAPRLLIESDGVWVKTGGQFSSAHRDCHEAAAGIPATARCAYCGVTGPAELFEPFNSIPGNVACRATAACQLRQEGADPAYEAGVLIRAMRKELPLLTAGQLTSLAVDLEGLHEKVMERVSWGGQVRLAAIVAERDDRERRAAGKAARAGRADGQKS